MPRTAVTVWSKSDTYDHGAITQEWNLLLFKKHTFIIRRSVQVGKTTFTPGTKYGTIGSPKKTSAGFVYYQGEPLKYVGVYDGFLLFERDRMPKPHPNYVAFFYAFFILDKNNLFTLTHSGAGRIMEME